MLSLYRKQIIDVCATNQQNEILRPIKSVLHCRIFRATCLATTLGNKLHEPLHSVIYLETAQIIAKQAAAIVDETRIEFLQGFQPLFSALHSEHSHLQLVSQFFLWQLQICIITNFTMSATPLRSTLCGQVAQNVT